MTNRLNAADLDLTSEYNVRKVMGPMNYDRALYKPPFIFLSMRNPPGGGKEEDKLYELHFLKLSWAHRYGRHIAPAVGCHWQLGSEESPSVAG